MTAVGEAAEPTVVWPDARRVRRALRLPLLIVLVVVTAAVLVGLTRTRVVSGELDPDAVDPAGSHALAMLLGEHGIPVHRVSTVDAAVAGGSGAAILVAFPDRLRPGELRRLAGATSRLILLGPDLIALREVTDQVVSGLVTSVRTRDPGCAEPGAQLAGAADIGGLGFLLGPDARGFSCYDGSLALARLRNGGTLVAFGSGQPMRNDTLDKQGNAALALNELGLGTGVGALTWLMPPVTTAADGQERTTLTDLLPPWVPAAALELLVAGLLLVLWRGRRLGPPVSEPLPVVVRAAETVHGRARLYRRGQAHDQAARALRAGALARIVPALRLGTAPPPDAVVAATAARTGRSGAEVGGLLYGPPPLDDPGLVRLADALDALVVAALRR